MRVQAGLGLFAIPYSQNGPSGCRCGGETGGVSESFGWWKLNLKLINSRYCWSCCILAEAGEMFWWLSVIILGVLDVV